MGGVYEGGGVNPTEARIVADAVCQHIKEHPDLSLGVGTFNIKQQTLIKDELDRRRREDPSLEFFFARKGEEEFFVKNLENIQGDDRDVIFLSITYGPGSDGKIRYNFGPINGTNGWRRLNVILTRAKLRLKVFSSMRADNIDPSRATSDGARYLRDFLNFAERGILSAPEVDDKALIQSPFEKAVYEELTKHGLRLVPQVGQAGYRIDFGVLDEETRGRFLLGIECDGATYHNAATARDRDRLRQKVLEDLGWRLIRIWSTDWYHNQDSQIKRVLDCIAAQKGGIGSNLPEARSNGNGHDFTLPEEQVSPNITNEKPSVIITNPQNSTAVCATNVSNTPELVPYKFTPVQILGDIQDFNARPDHAILTVMKSVIEHEAPIHKEELKRRVAAHWQISRIGARINMRLDRLLQKLLRDKVVFFKGDFVWITGETDIAPRARDVDSYAFSAESLPPEELDASIRYILADGKPRNKEELVTEVVKALGFGRAGQKLSEYVRASIQLLLENSLLEPCSTGLRLATNNQVQKTEANLVETQKKSTDDDIGIASDESVNKKSLEEDDDEVFGTGNAVPNAKAESIKPKVVRESTVGLVTQVLFWLNIALFYTMLHRTGMQSLFNPSVHTLLISGADYGPLTASGEYWRTITSMFVHIGLFHLIMNMATLSSFRQFWSFVLALQNFCLFICSLELPVHLPVFFGILQQLALGLLVHFLGH